MEAKREGEEREDGKWDGNHGWDGRGGDSWGGAFALPRY